MPHNKYSQQTVLLFFLCLIYSSVAFGENAKPNIIMIYADDLGIGMLGCSGQKIVKTPHIDKLSTQGMKFNNYYGGVLCAPARWTLMTGMHDGRLGGWKQNKAGLLIEMDTKKITEDTAKQKLQSKLNTSILGGAIVLAALPQLLESPPRDPAFADAVRIPRQTLPPDDAPAWRRPHFWRDIRGSMWVLLGWLS